MLHVCLFWACYRITVSMAVLSKQYEKLRFLCKNEVRGVHTLRKYVILRKE